MTEKWTKGPWRVRVNSKDSPDECDLSICGDIFVLADLRGPQYDHQHANAHLIAAAPDLYAALERTLNFIENAEGELGIVLDSGSAARAALAKARGEA
jgi:hypothetical protein